MPIHEMVQTVLRSNQFASGGLLLLLVGAIGASLRKIPNKLYFWLLRFTSITVTVKDEDAVFGWIRLWFSTQKFAKKTRNIDLDTSLTGEVLLLPAPGSHWFWYKRRLMNVMFERTDNKNPGGYGSKRTESFAFWVISRNRNLIKDFVEDVTKLHRERVKEVPHMYKFQDSYWEQVAGYQPRTLDSVILPQGQRESLVADMQKFLGTKERYMDLGIPYHRGYLLYGPPGTGKSSLAAAIAGHLNMGLYVINLNEFNDRHLAQAMNRVGRKSVILFEDIDAMNMAIKDRPIRRQVEEDEDDDPVDSKTDSLASKFGVTLSGLLNVLDGVDAPSDVIYIMTTNREVELDIALTRPGRIDYKLCMGEATQYQKEELVKRFFPDMEAWKQTALVRQTQCKTVAEFQGELLQLEHSIEQELEKKYA